MARRHRTIEQWREIVTQQKRAGVSARRFCIDHRIDYSTFVRWRRKVRELDAGHEVELLDVTHLLTDVQAEQPWDVELTLGEGMLLRLRRRA